MKFLLVLSVCVGLAAAAAYHEHHDHDHHDHHDHHEHRSVEDHKDHKHEHKDEKHEHKDEKHEHKVDHKEELKEEHKDKHMEEHKEEHKDEHKDEHKGGVLKDMETEGIIPDVIKKLPTKPLSVVFEKKEVKFGNELTPTEVKHEPKVTWEADKDTFYTLAMVDPDAPSRKTPTLREFNHWLVVNIHGSDIASGEAVAAFLSSAPPKDTSYHRYVFLLFKQSKKLTVDEPKSPALSKEHRTKFSIAKFAEKYHLGDAIAGNFYKAKWDAYVEELNKKVK